VDVAVGVDGDWWVHLDAEGGDGVFAGVEIAELAAVLGLEEDEADVVVFGHWMLGFADLDGYPAAVGWGGGLAL